MTEKGYEGEHLSPSWDIAGPSSLAAILDTVFTSTTSDNQQRNGKYLAVALSSTALFYWSSQCNDFIEQLIVSTSQGWVQSFPFLVI